MAKNINKSIRVGIRVFAENQMVESASKPTALFKATQVVTRTRGGVGVPNYKSKIRLKQNATSDLTGRFETLDSNGPQYNSLTVSEDDNGYWGTTGGGTPKDRLTSYTGNMAEYALQTSIPTGHLMAFDWGSTADAKASNKFLAQIRQQYTQFSAGTFFGELHQTLRMIAHPAEALSKQSWEYIGRLGNLKKVYARTKHPHRWRDAAPSLWLEYAFGWKPLLADIQNGFDAANSLLDQEHVVRVKGSGMSEKTVVDTTFGASVQPAYNSYLLHNGRQRIIERDAVRYYGAINVQAGSSGERYARWGFTPDDFVPTAWELLPWSFLIDYFASIGDFISGVFTRTANVTWCSKVRHKESEMLVVATPYVANVPPAGKPRLGGSSPSSCIWKRVDLVRTANAGVPTPALYLKTDGPSSGQWANMSALFGQACVNLLPQNKKGPSFRLPR